MLGMLMEEYKVVQGEYVIAYEAGNTSEMNIKRQQLRDLNVGMKGVIRPIFDSFYGDSQKSFENNSRSEFIKYRIERYFGFTIPGILQYGAPEVGEGLTVEEKDDEKGIIISGGVKEESDHIILRSSIYKCIRRKNNIRRK